MHKGVFVCLESVEAAVLEQSGLTVGLERATRDRGRRSDECWNGSGSLQIDFRKRSREARKDRISK